MQLLLILLPAVADALPFIYLWVAPSWTSAPWAVVAICSFAPPVVGTCVLISLVFLRLRKMLPSTSDTIRVGIVLAAIGIIEPIFYWI